MKIKKTVTEKMVVANRKNAKRSTGPRTARGKNVARFNAMKWGLFSESVAISQCDGESAGENYKTLVKEHWKQWRPVGPHENWLVQELAKTQWRFRRAAIAERGSARAAGGLDLYFRDDPKIRELREFRSGVEDLLVCMHGALQEIRQTGKLSITTCG